MKAPLRSFAFTVSFILLFNKIALAVAPVITSINPAIGYPSSSVIITGANFDATPANNIVFFGAEAATVNNASTTSLTVTVPTGATFSPISVTNTTSGLTVYSENPFLPSYAGVNGLVNFNTHIDLTNAGLAGVALGDLDGDGKVDLVVSNQGSNQVEVYRNISTSGSLTTGSFASAVSFGGGSGPAFLTIADVDGDGKLDIIAADFGSNTVAVLRNTATSGVINSSSFASSATFTVGSSPEGVAVGDLDGDGKPDLAVLNQTLGTMSLLRNTSTSGTISFASQVVFSVGSVPFFIAIADIDGDGKPDIVETNFNANNFYVFRNTATVGVLNSSSLASPVSFTANSETIGLAVADFDGDGKPDVAVSNFGAANISVFRNTATSGTINASSFATKVDFGTLISPIQLGVGDIDGDGKPDIISGQGSSGSHVCVLINNATSGSITSGSFSAHHDLAAGLNPEWVAVGDLDGDGAADIAVVNVSGTTGTSVIRNNPVLSIRITSVNPQVGYPASSVTITGDNFDATPANNIVYFGATKATVTAASTTSLTVNVPTGATYGPVSVTNITTNLTAYSDNYFLQDYNNSSFVPGKVNFNNFVDFTAPSGMYFAAIGDIDGDGKPDLVTANYGTNTVSVFRNISSSGSLTTGSFAAPVDFATGSGPYGITIADVDGDGKPDIVVVNKSDGTVSVLRNTSSVGVINSGSFAAHVDFPAGGATGDFNVAIGDLDGDGKPEIAVGTGYNFIAVLKNTSTPGVINGSSFAAEVDFGTAGFVSGVAIADLNGDGKPELIATGEYANNISVLQNTTIGGTINSGSFAAHVDFSVGNTVNGLAVGDIDGDGKPDIVSANVVDNTISILRNTSGGVIDGSSFAAHVDFATGSGPYTVAIGDIDGDGKPDIAAVNSNDNTVSVFRNTSSAGTITSGSLATAVNFPTGYYPLYTGIGDIDGDGRADIVTGNFGGTISVLWNNPMHLITGTLTFCSSGGTTLSDATTNGTWSSSNTGVATVGSSSGIVTGVAGGTAMITYAGTAGVSFAGNYVTATVTVNATPAMTVTPTSQSVCNSANTTAISFTSSTGGTTYSWANNNTAIGIAASGSGNIASFTATNGGTSAISGVFTVTPTANSCTGISQTFTITVNPTPRAISGNTNICGTTTTILTTTDGAGTWTSSNTSAVTIDGSGNATGVLPGTSTITYTNPSTGCSTTVIVTDNAFPAVSPITGNTTLSTAITTTLNDATGGGVWASGTTGVATINASTGVVSPVTTGTALISYTVTTSGCSTTVTANVMVNSPTSGLNFDGVNDYVSVPVNSNIPTGSSAYTIEAWIKPSASGGLRNGIAGWGNYGLSNAVNAFRTDGPNTLINYWWGNDLSVTVPNLEDGNWHHVAATYDGTTRSIYCDGVLMGSDNPTGLSISYTANMTIGVTNDIEYFTGSIDEVRIWNTGRTQAQIQANMNCDIAQDPSLVTYYRFDEGIAGADNTGVFAVVDYSGNGNCGHFNNFAVTGGTSNYETGAVGNCNPLNIGPGTITGNAPICSGTATVTLGNTVSGGTWSSGNTAIATIDASSGVLSGVSGGTANITYTLNCSIVTVIATINQTPGMPVISNQEVCNNAMTAAVTFSGTTDTTYTWDNVGTSIGGPGSGTGNIPSFTATNPGTSSVYADIIVVPSTSTCDGSAGEFTITVDPTPTVDSVGNQAVCNNANTTDIYFNGSVSGTTYNWTNSDGGIGFGTSGSGTIYSFTANNVTSVPDTATITVTPVANSCSGTSRSFEIIVNPTPVMGTLTSQTLCNNTATTEIDFSSSVSGTTYAWTNSDTTIGLTGSGTSNISSFTATNSSSVTVTGVIVVTPTANGCAGASQTIMINVNPQPVFTPVTIPAVCQGVTNATLSFSGLMGGIPNAVGSATTFSYTGSVQTYTVAPGVTTLAVDMTGAPGGVFPGYGPAGPGGRVQCNIAVTPGDVYYVYVGQVGQDGACCGGPIPQGGLNSGGGADGGAGSNDDGGAAGGASSDIRLSTPAMAGSIAASLSTRVVVAGGGGGGSYDCGETGGAGGGITGGDGSDCGDLWIPGNGGSQSAGGIVEGTGATAGGFGFGGDAFPNYYGSGGGGGWYGGGGCYQGSGGGGSSYPAMNGGMISRLIHTQGYNASGNGYVTVTPMVTTYTYSIVWSTGATGAGFSNVTGDTITSSPVNIAVPAGVPAAVYTGTLTLNNGSCTTDYPISVTVNATPNVDAVTSQAVCNNAATTAVVFTGSVTPTTYSWTNSDGSIGLANSGTGDIASFTATNSGTAAVTSTVTVTPATSFCTGMPGSFIITVNPTPANITGTDSVCAGSSTLLGDADAGGTWSISNSNATVATTGLVLGVTAGTSVVTYTLPTSCITTVVFTVDTLFVPGISISNGGSDTSCVGTPVLFTPTPVHAGASPVYIWLRNNSIVAIAPTYEVVPVNGDNIFCKMATSQQCQTTDTTASNHIVMQVDSSYIPIVDISVTPGTSIHEGEAVTFQATVTHGGPDYTYQWARNFSPIAGATTSTYSSSTLSNNDSISCGVKSVGPCGYFSFNSVTMHVSPAGTTIPVFTGGVTIYPNPTNGEINIKAEVAGVFYLYSLEGKSLGEYNVTEGITSMALPNELAPGIYMGRYEGNDGSKALFKIVKD